MAAQSTTVTNSVEGFPLKKIKVAWISAAAGTVTQTLHNINGQILRVTTDPGATAPTASWDMVIEDVDAVDILLGLGADRSATVTESVCPVVGGTAANVPVVTMGQHTLKITNAGDAKTGTVHILWKEMM